MKKKYSSNDFPFNSNHIEMLPRIIPNRRVSSTVAKDLFKRIHDLASVSNSTETAVKTLSILAQLDKSSIDKDVTVITNPVFLSNTIGVDLVDQYRSFLRDNGLDMEKFEIKRLINDNQYELAVMKSIACFEKEVNQTSNKESLARDCYLFKLLKMATDRVDSTILNHLLTLLESHQLINHTIYQRILISSINNEDFETVDLILDKCDLTVLTENMVYQIGQLYVLNEKKDQIFELLRYITDPKLKMKLVMDYIGKLPIEEGFPIIDELTELSPDIFSQICFNDLPMEYQTLKGLKHFNLIEEKLMIYDQLKNPQLKQVLIECILESIGKTISTFNPNIFILKFIFKNDIAISESLSDIICHNVSKTNLKLTSWYLQDYLNLPQLKDSNWLHLFKPLMNGQEPDLIYLFLIKIHQVKGQIPSFLRPLLNKFIKHTKDKNILYILSPKASIEKFKSMINEEYISSRLEDQQERERSQYDIIPGFGKYVYKVDSKSLKFLKD